MSGSPRGGVLGPLPVAQNGGEGFSPAPAHASPLELRSLVKHYFSGENTVRAVDGVSLQIEPGELVALYGPSGSGKSTLLMMIAALLTPDAGSILFGGRNIARLSSREATLYRRTEVALISQSFHLIPSASALDNAMIKLPPLGYSRRAAHAKALPWLDRVGISSRASHLPEQLSMGERQRLTIARALVSEPTLLLADEPTGSLDSVASRNILALLRDLCRERHMPGLIVTHDALSLPYVDRAHTLLDGHITAGPPAELAVS